MNPRIVSMSAVIALFALAGAARAQEADSNQRLAQIISRFHKADLKGDGMLTRDEAKQGMPRVYQHFAEIDIDNKGYVTLQQVTAYAAAHGRSRQASQSAPAQTP
jgi:Ca2+-binding EF-hand superfamily protein